MTTVNSERRTLTVVVVVMGVQIALSITPITFGPNEMIIKAGDPATHMYMIKSGVVAKSQYIFGRGMYFGDDFLLNSYFRPYVVRTLTYLDCFQLENTVIAKLFQFGQFPRLQVSSARWLHSRLADAAFLMNAHILYAWGVILTFPPLFDGVSQKRVYRGRRRLILQCRVVPYAKAVMYVPHRLYTLLWQCGARTGCRPRR